MNTRASILSALTVSLITLFVAAAPQRARAQATIFTLTDVVFDDGTKATGHFIVANGAIQSFDIETLAVGKGTWGDHLLQRWEFELFILWRVPGGNGSLRFHLRPGRAVQPRVTCQQFGIFLFAIRVGPDVD
jgi:hypothetical protein